MREKNCQTTKWAIFLVFGNQQGFLPQILQLINHTTIFIQFLMVIGNRLRYNILEKSLKSDYCATNDKEISAFLCEPFIFTIRATSRQRLLCVSVIQYQPFHRHLLQCLFCHSGSQQYQQDKVYVENGKKIFPSFCNLQLQLLFRVAYISTWGIQF